MLGEKYSNSDYQIYKETGNLNHFEEVIDLMMIDELRVKYNLTDDVIESIKGLDSTAKRNAILSLLDKEYSLYTKIAELSGFVYDESIGKIIDLKKNQVNKLEYIKQIILMLREYVKVGSVEKDKFGEVMTPLNVIKDMLAVLPDEVWSNPNLKWLDPANGTGPFPSLVIYKLMRGLEEWEPNPDKRYKHIIENMIYVCELQPKNMFLWLCTIDYRDEYDCNIYTGSFLDDGFDKHMKEVWEVDKFDVILGNPPYNDARRDNNSSSDIYHHFISKSCNISEYVMMITPSRWFVKSSMSEFRGNMLNKYGLVSIKHIDDNKFFNNTDIKGGVSYFLIKKGYKGEITFNGNKLDLNGFDIIPNLIDPLVFSILNKVLINGSLLEGKDIYNSVSHFGINTNDKRLSDNGDYKCYVSKQKGGMKYISNINLDNKKIDKWKLAIPNGCGKGGMNENFYIRYLKIKPGELCSGSFIFFDFDNEIDLDKFMSYMTSRLFSFLVRLRKIKQHVNYDIFKWVPNLDISRYWSDNEIFEFFELNKDEIDFILKHTE